MNNVPNIRKYLMLLGILPLIFYSYIVQAGDLHLFIQLALEHNLSLKSQQLLLSEKKISLNKAKKEEFNPQIEARLGTGWNKSKYTDSQGGGFFWWWGEEGGGDKDKWQKEDPTLDVAMDISRPSLWGSKLKLNIKYDKVIQKESQGRWEFSLESEEPVSLFQRKLIKDPLLDEKEHLQIAKLNLEDKINDIIYEVVTSFSELNRQNLQLNIKTSELQDLQDNLQIAKIKFEKGIIPEIDILQLELQIQLVQSEIETLKREKNERRLRFYNLLGTKTTLVESYDYLARIKDIKQQFGTQEVLLSALNHTTEVKIKQIGITQAQRKLKEAESKNLPVLVPSYAINKDKTTREERVRLSVRSPLYDRGVKKEEIKMAKNSLQQSVIELQDILNNSQIELSTTLEEIRDKERRLDVQQKNISLASQIYEISKIRHQRGLISSKDLLEYQTNLFREQKALFEQQIDLYLDYIKIFKLKGDLFHAYQENLL